MYSAPNMNHWHGRVDVEEGPLARRWHEMIAPIHADATPGIALLGFACDAGVSRNHGRAGARSGPAALRRALSGLAWRQTQSVWDAGDVTVADDELEAGQAALGLQLAGLLANGHRPIVLGGGREVAYGSFLGLARHAESHLDRRGHVPTIGIVSIAAHFDLRQLNTPSNGTPFAQIASATQQENWPFRYLVFGVAEPANTNALFQRAHALHAQWWLDDDCTLDYKIGLAASLQQFAATVDWLYLSISLDALASHIAPGVSAPAARGIETGVVEALIDAAKASGKLKLADIAELNPAFDVDQRTARIAARLVWRLARDNP